MMLRTVVTALAIACAALAAAPQTAGSGLPGVLAPADGTFPVIGDTLWSFPTPATWPSGLTWDGQHFWTTDLDSSLLYRLDSTGVLEQAFTLPDSANGSGDLEWDGTHLWMVHEGRARLYKLDPVTGGAVKSFRLPDSANRDPGSYGLAWDGEHLWHSQYGTAFRIFQLDTADGTVLAEFAPPTDYVLGIEWDGEYLWGLDFLARVIYKMEVPSGTVVDTYGWAVPRGLSLELVDGYMWNVSTAVRHGGTASVYKVDFGQGGIAGPVSSPTRIRRCRVSPNPTAGPVRLTTATADTRIAAARVFDMTGRQVGTMKPTAGSATWSADVRNGPGEQGVYLVQVRYSDGTIETLPVTLVRQR